MPLVIDDVYLPATLTAPPMTDEEFVEFCAQFPDYFLEMSAEGEILIMPPSDYLTSAQIARIIQQLSNWSDANRYGWITESSGGFVLPNGADAVPAWLGSQATGPAFRIEKRPRFPHFAPDFVVELRSPDDRLSRLRPKCASGSRTGPDSPG